MTPAAGVITVVGESLVDVIVREGPGEPALHPGGSPANVAVALSRLGQRTALVTQIGTDAYGALLRAHLETNGVRPVLAGPADAPTSRAIAHLDATGAASYRFELTWDVRDLRLAENSAGLHVGSLGTVLAPGGERVRRLAEAVSRRGDVVISYDPNVRASVTPDSRGSAAVAGRMAALAHVVKMSDEDLAFLFPGTTPRQLAGRLLGPGAGVTQLLVVTRGPRGAVVATRNSSFSVAAIPITVVDTVGAGDAFMAALLAGLADAGLLSAEALAECATSGAAVLHRIADQAMAAAALTCTRPGADPPTAQELRRFLAGAARPADGGAAQRGPGH
jgi:fructokinase